MNNYWILAAAESNAPASEVIKADDKTLSSKPQPQLKQQRCKRRHCAAAKKQSPWYRSSFLD
jgi:hypothetical protein